MSEFTPSAEAREALTKALDDPDSDTAGSTEAVLAAGWVPADEFARHVAAPYKAVIREVVDELETNDNYGDGGLDSGVALAMSRDLRATLSVEAPADRVVRYNEWSDGSRQAVYADGHSGPVEAPAETPKFFVHYLGDDMGEGMGPFVRIVEGEDGKPHLAVGPFVPEPASDYTSPQEDERIVAWHEIARHPFFASCFDDGDVLLPAMIRKLNRTVAALSAGAPAETPMKRDYEAGLWCGECRYGVMEDPPCCTQPVETPKLEPLPLAENTVIRAHIANRTPGWWGPLIRVAGRYQSIEGSAITFTDSEIVEFEVLSRPVEGAS